MRPLILIPLFLVLTGAGCRKEPVKLGPGQNVTLRGQLAEGAECPVLVFENGRKVSLAGELGGFKPGDRVCVSGSVVQMSVCMAGEATIAIRTIGPEGSCP